MAPDRPWTRDDAEALRVAVGRFVRAGHRHDVLPQAQAAVLGALDRDGPLSIAQLAERGRVRHQSMRETVALLRDAGALTSARSSDDARKVVCSLTAPGRALLDRDRDARTAWIRDAADRQLTAPERATARQIAALLERLAEDDGDNGDEER